MKCSLFFVFLCPCDFCVSQEIDSSTLQRIVMISVAASEVIRYVDPHNIGISTRFARVDPPILRRKIAVQHGTF